VNSSIHTALGKIPNGHPQARRHQELNSADPRGILMSEAVLPPELTHEPSRRHLLEFGLPADGADLRFRTADEPLGLLAPGQGLDIVIGEAWSFGPVTLDGETGAVYLAEYHSGEISRDLLATDLPALARLIEVVQDVARQAGRPETRGGRRGAAVYTEESAAAAERLRAADPELHGFEQVPAYWGSILLLRALAWGARSGGPGELAYVFEPDLVMDLAETTRGRVHHYQAGLLPAGLTHEPTRQLLMEHGLPVDVQGFQARPEPLPTMAEVFDADTLSDRPYQGGFLHVGHWVQQWAIALDGANGQLDLPAAEDDTPAPYLHRDLSALLYACWCYERLRADFDRWQADDSAEGWTVFNPRQVLVDAVNSVIEAVDPQSFATPKHSWRMLAEDDCTGGLLCE
jgi:hypothetical protein